MEMEIPYMLSFFRFRHQSWSCFRGLLWDRLNLPKLRPSWPANKVIFKGYPSRKEDRSQDVSADMDVMTHMLHVPSSSDFLPGVHCTAQSFRGSSFCRIRLSKSTESDGNSHILQTVGRKNHRQKNSRKSVAGRTVVAVVWLSQRQHCGEHLRQKRIFFNI